MDSNIILDEENEIGRVYDRCMSEINPSLMRSELRREMAENPGVPLNLTPAEQAKQEDEFARCFAAMELMMDADRKETEEFAQEVRSLWRQKAAKEDQDAMNDIAASIDTL